MTRPLPPGHTLLARCLLLGALVATAGISTTGNWLWLFAVPAGSALAGLIIAAAEIVEARR
ncbi:hypothetical protein [Pseudonocardia sp.]|uniref:hypothetical protein n=1 Tax=Pseudonocardia sp. TaxID=60912 RepID=UPI003D0DF88F